MGVTRSAKTDDELDDAAIVDAIRSFIRVQASDWQRRQLNEVQPQVFQLVDAARERGDRPDVPAIIRQVYLKRQLPLPELT